MSDQFGIKGIMHIFINPIAGGPLLQKLPKDISLLTMVKLALCNFLFSSDFELSKQSLGSLKLEACFSVMQLMPPFDLSVRVHNSVFRTEPAQGGQEVEHEETFFRAKN